MATRSCIGIKHGDVIKAIYCHYDGYLGYVGRVLDTYYQSSPKVSKLISMGDMSMLGAEIGEQHKFESRNEYLNDETAVQCTFYKRDRGEEDSTWGTFHSEEEMFDHYDGSGIDYYYLYDHSVWYVKASYNDEFNPLHEELAKEKEQANA